MNVRIALFGSALTITALLGPAIAVGENPIVPDEIADVRSNRAKLFEPKLTVRMNILKLGHGRAVRVTPKVAVDATGKSLVDPKIEVRWKPAYGFGEVEVDNRARGQNSARVVRHARTLRFRRRSELDCHPRQRARARARAANLGKPGFESGESSNQCP